MNRKQALFLTLICVMLFLWCGLTLSRFLDIPLTTALSYMLLSLGYMTVIFLTILGINEMLGDEEDVSEET